MSDVDTDRRTTVKAPRKRGRPKTELNEDQKRLVDLVVVSDLEVQAAVVAFNEAVMIAAEAGVPKRVLAKALDVTEAAIYRRIATWKKKKKLAEQQGSTMAVPAPTDPPTVDEPDAVEPDDEQLDDEGQRRTMAEIPVPTDTPTVEELDDLAAGQHRLIQGARAAADIMIAAIAADVGLADENERQRLYLACEVNRQLLATANAVAQHERWLRQFYYPTADRLRRE